MIWSLSSKLSSQHTYMEYGTDANNGGSGEAPCADPNVLAEQGRLVASSQTVDDKLETC